MAGQIVDQFVQMFSQTFVSGYVFDFSVDHFHFLLWFFCLKYIFIFIYY